MSLLPFMVCFTGLFLFVNFSSHFVFGLELLAGTQMYRRFSSYAFEACLDENVSPDVIYSAVMSEGVGAAIPTTASVNALMDLSMMAQKKSSALLMKTGWSQTIRPFDLPYGMDVVLGDVCGGSSSTSMVTAFVFVFVSSFLKPSSIF